MLLSLCYICQGFYGISHHKTLSISKFKPVHLFNKKSIEKVTQKYEKVVIPGSYNVAIGFFLSSLGTAFGLHNIFLSVPFGLIGALLFVQTGRIRFVFDTDSKLINLNIRYKCNTY